MTYILPRRKFDTDADLEFEILSKIKHSLEFPSDTILKTIEKTHNRFHFPTADWMKNVLLYLPKDKSNSEQELVVTHSKYDVHEAFIGICLNRLNSDIFCRVKGVFVGDEKIQGSRFITEYIGGPSLNDYIYTCRNNTSKIRSVLLKIIEGLFLAYKEINFVHYDLHLNNVLIGDSGPVLIDFEQSYVNVEGGVFGVDSELGGVYKLPLWQHDMFKLLIWTYHICFELLGQLKSNGDSLIELKEALEPLIDFFFRAINKKASPETVLEYKKNYSYYELSPELRDFEYDYDEFIVLARKVL